MREREPESGLSAGISDAESAVDLLALVAQLEEELRRAGPRRTPGGAPSSVRLNARATAERLSSVTLDRPIGGRGGVLGFFYRPVKRVVRKLARWYVEPVFSDQRTVNDALLRLIDDLYEHVDRLEAELRELRPGIADERS